MCLGLFRHKLLSPTQRHNRVRCCVSNEEVWFLFLWTWKNPQHNNPCSTTLVHKQQRRCKKEPKTPSNVMKIENAAGREVLLFCTTVFYSYTVGSGYGVHVCCTSLPTTNASTSELSAGSKKVVRKQANDTIKNPNQNEKVRSFETLVEYIIKYTLPLGNVPDRSINYFTYFNVKLYSIFSESTNLWCRLMWRAPLSISLEDD